MRIMRIIKADIIATAATLTALALGAAQAQEAPAGVVAPGVWLHPGMSARAGQSVIARLPDGTRYKAQMWWITDADGEPAVDPDGGAELSGVYTAKDDGTGWSCGRITLEGDCLPMLPGDHHMISISSGEWYASPCLERIATVCTTPSSAHVQIEDLTDHDQPPPPPGVSSVAFDSPNYWTYMSGEIRFTAPNSEQSQILATEARLYHPDTGALELTLTTGNPCNPDDNSNLCTWQTGWCAARPSDGGGVYKYEIHVQTISGVTSTTGRETMTLWCP